MNNKKVIRFHSIKKDIQGKSFDVEGGFHMLLLKKTFLETKIMLFLIMYSPGDF